MRSIFILNAALYKVSLCLFTYQETILSMIEKVLISVYGQLPKPEDPSPECLSQTGLAGSNKTKNYGTLTTTESSLVADAVNTCPENITFANNISNATVDKMVSVDGNIVETTSGEKPLSSENMQSTFVPEVDVTFALVDDYILSKGQPNGKSEIASYSSLVPVPLNEQILAAKDPNELTADDWSKGVMKDSTEQTFAPVKLLVPQDKDDQEQITCNETNQHNPTDNNPSSSQSTNPSNVVQHKIGQITLYDLISNRTVKKSLSASALFTQETRPKLLAENPRANLQDVSMKLEEMWKNLNEDEKKK